MNFDHNSGPAPVLHATSSRRQTILLLVFLALALRLIYFMENFPNPLLYYHILDESYYINLGQEIAGGHVLGGNTPFFMDPLYGYFLGGVFFFFGDNLTTIRLIQILLDTFNAVLIFGLADRLWNRRTGIIAGLLYACYKVAFFYPLLILKTTLAVNGLLLYTYCLLHASERDKNSDWLWLGMLAGLLTYLRANFLLLVPLTMLLYWLTQDLSGQRWRHHALLLCGGFLLLLAPGGIRNYLVANELTFLNSQSGRLLYACNNPENLTGFYQVPAFSSRDPVGSEKDFHLEAEKRLKRQLTASEVSRYWSGETIRFFRLNPEAIPRLLWNKLIYTIAAYEIPNNQSFYATLYFSKLAQLPWPNFAFALSLGVPGLLLGIIRRRQVALLLVPILIVSITIMIYYTSSRFRLPLVPFLLIGAAISLDTCWTGLQNRKASLPLLLLLCAIFLALLTARIPPPTTNGGEEFALAQAYYNLHNLPEAEEMAQRGLKISPHSINLLILQGNIAATNGRHPEMITWCEKALAVEPNNQKAHNNLILAYLMSGQPHLAVQAATRAYAKTGADKFLELYKIATAAVAAEKIETIPEAELPGNNNDL